MHFSDMERMQSVSLAVSSLQRISKNQNYRISAEEHFWDVAILVNWLRLLLSFSCLRYFSPHLLHIFKNHVAMSTNKHARDRKTRNSSRDETGEQYRKIAITAWCMPWLQSFTSHILNFPVTFANLIGECRLFQRIMTFLIIVPYKYSYLLIYWWVSCG